VRIFKSTWFARFAAKEGITDGELKETVNRLESGQAEAALGGGVYKARVARPGEGKSGGYRVIVFFRSENRTFYIYGFAKSARSNISRTELKKLKKQAGSLLPMSEDQIEAALKEGVIIEVQENCHEREVSD
jgi:hypothetical protein